MRAFPRFLLIGLIALTAATAWAGVGPGRSPGFALLRGTVQSLDPATGDLQSFVIATLVPPGMGMPSKTITVNVTSTTQYFLQSGAGTAADVIVGATVVVQLTGFDGSTGTALRVALLPPPTPRPTLVAGTVQSIDPATGDLLSFVVQPKTLRDGTVPAAVTANVTADTKYFLGMKAGASTDVTVGAIVVVALTGFANNAGTATRVEIKPAATPRPPRPTIVAGTVQSLDPATGDLASFVVQPATLKDGTVPAAVTANVTADTKYFLGMKAGASTDVTVGAIVVVALTGFANNAGTATRVEIKPAATPRPPRPTIVAGTVQSLAPATGDLQSFVVQPATLKDGTVPAAVTANVTADTKYFLGMKAGASTDVTVGATVVVALTGFANNAGTATTVKITPPKPPKPTRIVGSVTSVSTDTGGALQLFVVQPATLKDSTVPAPVTVTVTATTQYFLGRKAGASTDVTVGATVAVRLTGFANNAGTALVVGIKPAATP